MLLDEEGKIAMEKHIADRGYYPIMVTETEFAELNADPVKVENLFVEQVL